MALIFANLKLLCKPILECFKKTLYSAFCLGAVCIYRYQFQATGGKAFKLLCYIIKKQGVEISIEEACVVVSIEHIADKKKKNRIKDYLREIREKLKISEDQNPSVNINIINNYLVLISNPPVIPLESHQ